MTSPTHAHTTPDDTAYNTTAPTASDLRPAVTDRVVTALEELDSAGFALGPLPRAAADWATRSAAMALISARQAGWWRVLLVADKHAHPLHPLFRRAVASAHRRALDDARFWRDAAADWQARADHRPTSDAAGSLSNWSELG